MYLKPLHQGAVHVVFLAEVTSHVGALCSEDMPGMWLKKRSDQVTFFQSSNGLQSYNASWEGGATGSPHPRIL